MPPTKDSTTQPALSPLSIVRMLWKHKALIAVLWAVLGAAVGIVIWKLPPVYSAEAVILVDSQKIPDKYVTSTVSADLQDRLATINQQILSATRLKKIIEDFDLYRNERKTHVEEEIIEMMRKNITVKVERGWVANRPGAFRIIYQGENPALVAQVANRIASLYIEENMKTREVQAEGTADFIETQLQQAKKKLDELEATVSAYKVKHSGELPQQENSLAGNLARLQVELEANRDAMNRAQQTKVLLESSLGNAEAELSMHQRAFKAVAAPAANETAPADTTTAPGPRQPAPRRESEILEAQLSVMRVRYSDDHPEVKRLQASLDRVKQLERAETPAAPAAAPAPVARAPKQQAPKVTTLVEPAELVRARERVESLRTQIGLAGKENETRKADQQRIISNIHAYQARIERLPVREQEMAQITRDYEMSKANYKSLLDKRLSAEMATDMERRQKSERFTILDSARIPEIPVKPKKPMLAAAGALGALLVSLALAFVIEQRKGLFLGEWELPPNSLVLGRLPEIQFHAAEPAKPSAASRRTA